MAQEKLGTFKIDGAQWDNFKAKAQQDGTNASALLKAFIDAYLNGRIDAGIVRGLDGIDADIEKRIYDAIAGLSSQVQSIDNRLEKLSA